MKVLLPKKTVMIYIYYQADANLTQDYKVKIERMEDRADSVYTVLDEIILR